MYHKICWLSLFLLLFNSVKGQKGLVQIPASSWVSEINFEVSSDTLDGPEYYLLIDIQENVLLQEQYFHFAIKLLTSEGVQNQSTISINFDPQYEKLIVHEIVIHREDQEIKKGIADFKILQRETELSRSIYDGSLSAVKEIKDVRTGDIVEYSYTLKGYNPIFENDYFTSFYQNYSVPVARIYHALITPEEPIFKYFGKANEMNLERQESTLKYTANLYDVPAHYFDNVSPPWFEHYKTVFVTSMSNWSEVVNWALPLYRLSENAKSELKRRVESNLPISGSEQDILTAIRFVQDEIRYLGFEEGISAFRPHSPVEVWDQRFGDCKDKSFLLSSILESMGVPSSPVLVNTIRGFKIKDRAPSPVAFDHCIVTFKFNNKEYFVDPTISNQGGDLSHMSTPDYSYGLIINKDSRELAPLIEVQIPSSRIDEVFILDSIPGGSTFSVTSTYTGSKADELRNYFSRNSKNDIRDNYRKYYANDYPSIQDISIEIIDTSRLKNNNFIVKEEYYIPNLWVENEAKGQLEFQISPGILENYTSYSFIDNDSLPFNIGSPIRIIQNTTIQLPEDWTINPEKKEISNDYFKYKSSISYENQLVEIQYDYHQIMSFIEASEVPLTLGEYKEMSDDIGYTFSYDMGLLSKSDSHQNYALWVIIFIGIIISGFVGRWMYFRYDPLGRSVQNEDFKLAGISGWLILPFLGLIFTPFVFLYSLINQAIEGSYSWNNWVIIWTNENVVNGKMFIGLVFLEVIYNVVIILLSVILIILFFKKRTSVPNLMICFYCVIFLFLFFDSLILYLIGHAELNEVLNYDLFKSLVHSGIWIPYFIYSQRVSETFTVRLRPDNEIIENEVATD